MAAILGCGVPGGSAAATPSSRASKAGTADLAGHLPAAQCKPGAPPANVSPPKRILTIDEARRYMLALINRDRRTECLAPVELDDEAAMRAGQLHAEDMATHGYLGHWGTDGSTPEQRHTEAGGADMVLENASCFIDERARTLDKHPPIAAEEVEKTESMFFHETPPNDGHRQNILKPQHRKVGIGIAQPIATATELPVPCFSQEFTDPYGTYAPLPKHARVGEKIRVEGAMLAPAAVGGVGLARVDAPKAIAPSEANRRRSYPVPPPYQTYWPSGFVTPIPVAVDAKQRFHIDVPLSDGGRPGMYEVSIWARLPGSNDPTMVGLRTIRVE